MPRWVGRSARGLGGLVSAGVLALTAGIGPVGPAAGQSPPPPHWGPYQWSGGAETAPVNAFWLIDRTGNQPMHDIIGLIAEAWNSARTDHPELPFIGVYQDDANVGRCFVNELEGWSVATACTIPENIEGVKGLAARHAGDDGHLIGAAMAVSEGLNSEELFSVVCHTMGHVVGLENSEDTASCMSHDFDPETFKWYSQDDAQAVLDLYGHSDPGGPTVTSTSTTAPEATTTVPEATTVPPTTEAPETSTTLEEVTTTLPDITIPEVTTP
jgi:hypothetical protein